MAGIDYNLATQCRLSCKRLHEPARCLIARLKLACRLIGKFGDMNFVPVLESGVRQIKEALHRYRRSPGAARLLPQWIVAWKRRRCTA